MIYRNRKTKRKETPKPDPSKIQTGSKIIYFSPISIQLQQKILRILNIFSSRKINTQKQNDHKMCLTDKSSGLLKRSLNE